MAHFIEANSSLQLILLQRFAHVSQINNHYCDIIHSKFHRSTIHDIITIHVIIIIVSNNNY